MTDTMDALDMTIEDVVDVDECVNCLTTDEGAEVEGWGWLCDHCYGDMWDARLAQAF